MTDGEKLHKIRSVLKLSQEEIALKLEIKQGSYSDIERGKKDRNGKVIGISPGVRRLLIEKLNVNSEYLDKGEGPMFKEQTEQNANPQNNYMTEDDKNYFKGLISDLQKEKGRLLNIIEALSGVQSKARTGTHS